MRRPNRRDPTSFDVSVTRGAGADSDSEEATETHSVSISEASLDGTSLSATLNGHRVKATSVVLPNSNPKAPGNSSLDFFAPNHFPRPRYSLEVQTVDLGAAAGGAAKGSVTAPMPGKIIRVMVEPGQVCECDCVRACVRACVLELFARCCCTPVLERLGRKAHVVVCGGVCRVESNLCSGETRPRKEAARFLFSGQRQALGGWIDD